MHLNLMSLSRSCFQTFCGNGEDYSQVWSKILLTMRSDSILLSWRLLTQKEEINSVRSIVKC